MLAPPYRPHPPCAQAHTLQMEPPELYVRQNPIPNAYTLAIAGRKPFIVLHTALLELLTPRELQVGAQGRAGGAQQTSHTLGRGSVYF